MIIASVHEIEQATGLDFFPEFEEMLPVPLQGPKFFDAHLPHRPVPKEHVDTTIVAVEADPHHAVAATSAVEFVINNLTFVLWRIIVAPRAKGGDGTVKHHWHSSVSGYAVVRLAREPQVTTVAADDPRKRRPRVVGGPRDK